jgi:UDP-N-acetylglucosamine/UDP-N-acetylgalactosamine 4-epimerase
MTAFDTLKTNLNQEPKTWLVTGAAGFIGSHLVENLLRLGQTVVGLDNFATGHLHNLTQVSTLVGDAAWKRFRLVEGDIRNPKSCQEAVAGADYVLHQAALGSVPRSIADPLTTHAVNVDGTVNMLLAARDAKVKRMVFASSSSIYGDEPNLPKREDRIGKPLSPYALTKAVNEQYAENYGRIFGLETAGLRYFNVFGARQDPNGQYAAVIPRWTSAMIRGEAVLINGKGDTSRDFCFIDNVVQANLLAATAPGASGQAYNVALNDRTDLNQLFTHLRDRLLPHYPHLKDFKPTYGPYRAGDVMHSQAEIGKAEKLLGYAPTHSVRQGLDIAMEWYRTHLT